MDRFLSLQSLASSGEFSYMLLILFSSLKVNSFSSCCEILGVEGSVPSIRMITACVFWYFLVLGGLLDPSFAFSVTSETSDSHAQKGVVTRVDFARSTVLELVPGCLMMLLRMSSVACDFGGHIERIA